MSVCSPGAPAWTARERPPDAGYVLFFGTLEPRKNVGGLLDAYERLGARRKDVPRLVLAGQATEAARPWLERIARPPLDRLVKHIGYVDPGAPAVVVRRRASAWCSRRSRRGSASRCSRR